MYAFSRFLDNVSFTTVSRIVIDMMWSQSHKFAPIEFAMITYIFPESIYVTIELSRRFVCKPAVHIAPVSGPSNLFTWIQSSVSVLRFYYYFLKEAEHARQPAIPVTVRNSHYFPW